ncbi:hypothetical protein ABZR86_06970 [Dyella marensis]|uniref:Uncharacterized protein n=1 Tax=Dyella marensis TaxID=500610 RepID=A0A1I2G0M2_9GAMM|nr:MULTISPECIES: hypothetical protein [Dyella]SFF11254.1 hypothetical protein SAMN02799615_02495 [Dyella marensis]
MQLDELNRRIQEQQRLLLLEKRHLREVAAHDLDQSTARWVIDIRRREIAVLKRKFSMLQKEMIPPVSARHPIEQALDRLG